MSLDLLDLYVNVFLTQAVSKITQNGAVWGRQSTGSSSALSCSVAHFCRWTKRSWKFWTTELKRKPKLRVCREVSACRRWVAGADMPAAAWTGGCSGHRRWNWPPTFESPAGHSTTAGADPAPDLCSGGRNRHHTRRHALSGQHARTSPCRPKQSTTFLKMSLKNSLKQTRQQKLQECFAPSCLEWR